MNKIWANVLIRGGEVWTNVPVYRQAGVKVELRTKVVEGEITAEKYKEITNEDYAD